jgi:hypothetical protein
LFAGVALWWCSIKPPANRDWQPDVAQTAWTERDQTSVKPDLDCAGARSGMSDRSADGKELSRQKMEHTIPFLMSLDESLDIGMDTRMGVDDSYQLPFKFTGTIDKVTYNIGVEQLTAADHEKMQRAIAAALDTPTQ